jgi:hypothetical protein
MLWMSADIYSRRPYSVPVCDLTKNVLSKIESQCDADSKHIFVSKIV